MEAPNNRDRDPTGLADEMSWDLDWANECAIVSGDDDLLGSGFNAAPAGRKCRADDVGSATLQERAERQRCMRGGERVH